MFNKIRTQYHKTPTKLYDLGLSIEAIGLFNYLVSCSESFNPSLRYLSEKLGMSINRSRKYFKELENHNVIRCIHKGYKSETKKYEFIDPKSWR
jgi:hypothetical protein